MADLAPKLTPKDLNYLKAKADRVVLLLDASAMPPEVKTSWLTLVPEMDLNQVDRLIALLEEELELVAAQAKKQPEDAEFILKLKMAKERYDAQVSAANQKALTALKRIEEELPR